MKFKIMDIVGKVYAFLDENEEIIQELVYYGDPGVNLKSLIIMLLPDAASAVLSTMPLSRIDECRHAVDDTLIAGRQEQQGVAPDLPLQEIYVPVARHEECGRAVVRLPKDFLRLVRFRMSDWETGVSVPLASAGEERRLRAIPYRRSRRRTSPAVAITERGDIKELEVFNTASPATVAELDYISVPECEGVYIDLPMRAVSEICRRIAEQVADIIKDK